MRLSSSRSTAILHRPQQDFLLWDKAGTRPSLDLQFADRKDLIDATTGSNLVDHTRASSGTYVGSDGLIKTATTNLLLQSEDFSTTWSSNNYSLTTGFIAPDGTANATKIVRDTNNTAASAISQNVASVRSSTDYTYSVYVKAEEYSKVSIREGASTGAYLSVDLSSAAVIDTGGGTQDETIDFVGNGWYRISFRITTGASQTTYGCRIYALPDSYTTGSPVFNWAGDDTSGIYIWGAQLEQSDTVGEYIPTTSTINSAPRFDHDPVTGESLGLLVEESRTNLLTYSEDFENIAWQTTNPGEVTLIAGVADPAGGNNATTVYHDSGAGDTGWLRRIFSGTSGQPYSLSFWARRRTGAGDLLAVVGDNINQVINGVTSNWQRFSIVNTPTSSTVRSYLKVDSPGDQFDIWGAQLEEGSFPTSYIPTTSSTVTRAADVASITGSNFSSWYRQDEGTIYHSYAPFGTARNRRTYSFSDGTGDNQIRLVASNSSGTSSNYVDITTAGAVQGFLGAGTAFTATPQSGALGYILNNTAFSRNGAVVSVDTSVTIPVVNKLDIGSDFNNTGLLNGTIRRLTYWPTRLGNDTLQTITQ